HVCDTSQPTFTEDLTNALAETGATLGFDATGGGELTSHILAAMEAAANRSATEFSRYGSTVQKQVYVYGSLEAGPTVLHRTYGMSWSVGGWLLTNFLRRIPPETTARLKHRVAAEITTTFASHYTKVVSLTGALEPAEIAQYSKRATGQKYLIDPTRASSSPAFPGRLSSPFFPSAVGCQPDGLSCAGTRRTMPSVRGSRHAAVCTLQWWSTPGGVLGSPQSYNQGDL